MKKVSLVIAMAIMCSLSCLAKQNVKKYAISQKAMLERFMDYLSIESGSDDQVPPDTYPMTEGQIQMAQKLAADAKALGAQVTLTEWYYVYVTIPSNINRQVPSIGFSCHLDYSPEAPNVGIKPKIIKYKGGVINLGNNKTIDPATPKGKDLNGLIGKTIIHTDGRTLLGGDDKTGCAIVMSLIESALKNEFQHGELQFVFCPNEDIGMAALKIDTTYFNPEIEMDVDIDGGKKVTISNFTARGLGLRFIGHDAHPAEAKEKQLGDALAAASTFIARVPLKYRPEHTDGLQGYIHPYKMVKDSDANNFNIDTRIRFFDKAEGEEFDRIIKDNIDYIRQAFPYVKIETLYDLTQYDNVQYTMHPQSLDLVSKAAARCGIKLEYDESRGGTTAAMFTAVGLRGGLSVFSGQHNDHSVEEYAVLEEMYDSYMLLLTVIDEVTMMKK